jgi:two-component system sensor histidine kinase and response regulator WspE
MRPLADGITGYSRMVRDLGRSLGKRVRLELSASRPRSTGTSWNISTRRWLTCCAMPSIMASKRPETRRAAGKPEEGRVSLHAWHNAGRLVIEIFDDGAGVDLEALRAAIVRRGLAQTDTAARLSQAELLEFLLLPGFSMRETVSRSPAAGRLDAVQDMVRAVRGA